MGDALAAYFAGIVLAAFLLGSVVGVGVWKLVAWLVVHLAVVVR